MLISCLRIVRRIVLEKIEAQPSGKDVIHSLGSTQLQGSCRVKARFLYFSFGSSLFNFELFLLFYFIAFIKKVLLSRTKWLPIVKWKEQYPKRIPTV